ncbi:MAG: hypothetical protein QXP60_02535 [Nitrososphaerota archaeon]
MKSSFSEFLKNEYIENSIEEENISLFLPYISWGYLMGIDGIPLTRIIMIVGDPASFKTTFLYYISRIFHFYGGNSVIVDTESNKYSLKDEMLYNIKDEKETVFNITKPSMEEWQSLIFGILSKYKSSKNKENVGPLMISVDSVIGGLDDRTYKKAEKDGFVSTGFSPQPNILSSLSKKLCRDLYESKNVTIFLTNHEKKYKDPLTGIVNVEYPGGFRIKFMSSSILSFSKIKGPVRYKNRIEYQVKITVRKNRFGPEKNCIVVPWIIREDCRCAYFDFIKADLDFLFNFLGQNKATMEYLEEKISKVINIKCVSGGPKGKIYYCKELGISKEDGLDGKKLMIELYKNDKIFNDLMDVLDIKRFKKFGEFDLIKFLNQEVKLKSDSKQVEENNDEEKIEEEDNNSDESELQQEE